MNISNNSYVTLTYHLRLNNKDGDVIETVNKDHPLQFIYGQGNLLPGFEKQLDALTPGSPFSFTLSSDEAYGDLREEAIVDVPMSSFAINGEVDTNMVQVGKTIPMRDHHGNRMNGKITQVNGEFVTMDFNHPLAGRTLFFEGEILDVRPATEDELKNQKGHCGCNGDCQCDGDCNSNSEGHNEKTGASTCGCGGHH